MLKHSSVAKIKIPVQIEKKKIILNFKNKLRCRESNPGLLCERQPC